MRSSTLVSLVALAAHAQAVQLSKTEFNVLVSSRPALVLFTADGCKECDRVQAVLDRASSALTNTAIASVNCNDEPTVCDDSQVFTVPTLKFTTGNNKLVTYKEGLDASSVVKYIGRQSGSPVVDLTEENHLDFARSSRVAVIAFLGSDHKPEHKTFGAVAERWRAHYSFGSVHGLEKDSKGPSIAVYTQEEEDPAYYRGPFTVTGVEAFLRDATQPLIREYDPIVHEEAMKDERPLAQIFFSKRDDRAELVKSLAPLARKYKDQLSFVTVLAPDYPKRCEQMHLNKEIKRGFAIANQQGRAYPMSEKVFNANRVAKHVAAYLASSLTPSIKSEPVPEVSTSQPFLAKLVGSNFDDLVFDKSKDVLVEFYVPWCQYCTDLHAVLGQLGSKYAELGLSDKAALATINVDANDVPIEIDSYPSIRLYRAGTNEVVSFKGNFTDMLTVEQLDAFIAQSGSHGEDVKERGQQVVLMGQIFSGAWQVVVWLGEESDRCMCGNTVLETSLSSVSKAFSGVCAVVNDWLAQAGQEALEATYSELSKYDDSTVYRANINDGEDSRSYMMQLFRRRWFSRMWVLQEAVLARHALVQLGSYQIPWEWVGLAAAILVHKPELSPSGFGRDMIPTGAMNGYLMYRLSVSQKCFPRLEFSFAQLLQVSRYFQSKEPKDKVYGLLGIETTDSVGRQIVPDYRETINSEKVFEDIARLMLESANPLTFLSGAGTFGDYDRSRPSWVPSWHKRRPWTILPTKQDQGFQCASASRMEMRSDHKEGELVLKGVIVDQITSMQEHRDYWGIFDENDKSRNNLLNQPRWSTEAWRKCAMILTCGGDGRAYPIDDEATNLADLAALVLSRSAHWVIRDLIALRDVIEPEDDEMTQAEYLAEIAEGGNARRYISAVEPVRNSYRLFKTASKDFGVGPVDMKIGDKLCVLFGAEVPFLLRPKGDGYLVIGECYVYNLMHGEILEKLTADPEGQLKAEWIKLI
ncbi:hypothetical protein CEK26_008015 [Fusarium fujikuroi]|nr:hypothetical protein CEK27_008034 [Fusarium fujikuroi]QGI94946.1 hypothetical protein CEK26_008015 [Fusarium fujikuroi]